MPTGDAEAGPTRGDAAADPIRGDADAGGRPSTAAKHHRAPGARGTTPRAQGRARRVIGARSATFHRRLLRRVWHKCHVRPADVRCVSSHCRRRQDHGPYRHHRDRGDEPREPSNPPRTTRGRYEHTAGRLRVKQCRPESMMVSNPDGWRSLVTATLRRSSAASTTRWNPGPPRADGFQSGCKPRWRRGEAEAALPVARMRREAVGVRETATPGASRRGGRRPANRGGGGEEAAAVRGPRRGPDAPGIPPPSGPRAGQRTRRLPASRS
jgi:hypothetical protein